MTCAEFTALRKSKHVFLMTAAERTAMIDHFEACAPCRAETVEIARRARKWTPEEDAELDRLVTRDLLDPECQR